VLALRNAIDDADVDMLGEVAATCAAYGPPIEGGKQMLANLLRAIRGAVSHRGSVQ
jgi:hypothetical protein